MPRSPPKGAGSRCGSSSITRPVIRPLEATGLDQVLQLYRSVEDALEPRADPLP